MIKTTLVRPLILLLLTVALSACGGGGGGGGGVAPAAAPAGGGGAIAGGGVKGPLANAVVTLYEYDASQPGFKGAAVATGSTNAAAAITGLSLPFPVSPPYIMEITSNAGTTDITTGQAPVIATLRTVITQALLDTGEQIYATPLTTMAVDLAIANSNAGTTPGQFQTALATAATQVVSTLGFGMTAAIDIFDMPPLIDSTTDTTAEQADVAAYRTAIEALTAVAFQMQQQSGSASVDAILSELTSDLADGAIDGMVGGVASTVFTSTTLNVLAQDPATLPIPNTTLTVADVQAILVSEKATTGSTTATTQLETGGSITTTAKPAATNPDTDGDGVPNSEDAFPDDPAESVDTDGDGIGDVADPDDDNDGILDVDEGVAPAPTVSDTDGDGFDDGVDNCPATFNPAQTNTDGLADGGDACDADDDEDGTPDTADLFPLNPAEQSDADGDGSGDSADSDDDNDGIPDVTEDVSGTSADHDNDGKPNREDTDSDNDGALDNIDYAPYDDTVTFNNAPIAASGSITTNEDADVSIQLTVSDDGVPADPLVYSVGTPADGTLSGTAPNLTYTPDDNFNGSDSFTFSVTDGSGKVSNVATISITVFAVNDAPVVNAAGPFGISESAADGSGVGAVTATDIDSPITGYSIIAGNTGSAFAISANGLISVADTTAIDFESASSFTLSITATDGTATSDPRDISISISNANDVAPVVAAAGPFGIADGSANGTVLGSVSASDIDSTVTAFSITAGNTGGAFAINNSGAISVANTTAIDFDILSSYTLTIAAGDGVNQSAGVPVVVNITNTNPNAPVIAAGQSFPVAEDAANATIAGTLAANDPDGAGTITGFNITAGNTSGAFAINAAGVISVANATAIDFESANSFTLAVTATDGSNTSPPVNVIINITDVNDTAPVVNAAGPFPVAEDAADTTAVGSITATDADGIGAVTDFNIASGNTGGAFAISPTGVISVADTAAIDFESATTSFTLAITATDGTNTSDPVNVIVNVTDANDIAPVVAAVGPFSVAEDAADTTAVGTVTGTDADTVSAVTDFNIASGNTGGAFAISSGGVISVADTAAIDFESATTSFTLAITATDGTNTSDPVNVIVNVTDANDIAPVVAAVGPFSVAEDAADTTAVGTVTGTDADTVGAVTDFNIASGNTGGAFAISSGGVISVADTAAIDFESATTSFTLAITATDGTNTSNPVNVTVNVTDVNDSAPVVAAAGPFSVAEDAADTTAVGTVTATDEDTVGAVTDFNIASGNTGGAFAISSGGVISVADTAAIDFESATTSFMLAITATDGTNTSADPVNVTVNVTDVNDSAPVVTTGQSLGVSSSAANGAVVGTVLAMDADTVGTITSFSITGGNTGTAFAIAANGQITVASNTTLLANSPYTLTLTATDGTNVSAPETVDITVSTSGAAWDSFNWDDGSTWQ